MGRFLPPGGDNSARPAGRTLRENQRMRARPAKAMDATLKQP